jgi:hypothetical protein
LYRTDFFPGLGWMMSRKLWNELHPKWPLGFWDDWLREPEQVSLNKLTIREKEDNVFNQRFQERLLLVKWVQVVVNFIVSIFNPLNWQKQKLIGQGKTCL